MDFHNRAETLTYCSDGPGAICNSKWTSDLNVGRIFPGVANRLLMATLADWPIDLADRLPPQPAQGPLVSFIVGHRGLERLPHLLATLRSILGQRDVRFECLVVEQSWDSILAGRLPEGVNHFHLRPPVADLRYSRSWAFNAGARQARGDILVFHDNDTLVPAAYGREIARLMARGYQAARLQRFVFYLGGQDTKAFFAAGRLPASTAPEYCRQNCEGVTLAVERQAYFDVGGHDEAFLGWGGEDNEMFDRLRTMRSLRAWVFADGPFVSRPAARQELGEFEHGVFRRAAADRREPAHRGIKPAPFRSERRAGCSLPPKRTVVNGPRAASF